MEIKDFLISTRVALDIQSADKKSLLRMLATRAAAVLRVSADAVSAALEKREEIGSTGFGGGVSIPHARLREVEQPFSLLVKLSNPIDFNAIDGQPVDLVWLLLLPASSQTDELNALAAIVRKLRDPELIRKLRQATNKSELYRAIAA